MKTTYKARTHTHTHTYQSGLEVAAAIHIISLGGENWKSLGELLRRQACALHACVSNPGTNWHHLHSIFAMLLRTGKLQVHLQKLGGGMVCCMMRKIICMWHQKVSGFPFFFFFHHLVHTLYVTLPLLYCLPLHNSAFMSKNVA